MTSKGCTGPSTILVNVGGGVPLVLLGEIERETYRHSTSEDTSAIECPEEEFLVVGVTGAILPPGFPLTIAALTTDVKINLNYVIAIL